MDLKSPEVKRHIEILGDITRPSMNHNPTYDDRSYALIDKIFELLSQLQCSSEDKLSRYWHLWLCVDRGTIDDYGDYAEALEYGEVSSYQEFVEQWEESYPEEKEWFHFSAVFHKDINYKGIFLGRNFVLVSDPRESRYTPYDCSEFVTWLKEKVQTTVELIKNGNYNEWVSQYLPAQHRTGTVLLRDLWDIFPEWKEDFFEDFSEEEAEDFLWLSGDDPEWGRQLGDRLPFMTATMFYSYCGMGYRAMGYETGNLSFKEQYLKFADGRDEDLREIDPDSKEAFERWLLDKNRGGGHPWEVCRGGNSSHISLYVGKDERGYYLTLSGSSMGRTIETIRFYCSLKHAGLPVALNDVSELRKRIVGEEHIGVVPHGVTPKYCGNLFPEEKIIAFMNLPYDKRAEVAEKCVWHEEPIVRLIESHP